MTQHPKTRKGGTMILEPYYKEDALAYLSQVPSCMLAPANITADQIKADNDTVFDIWSLYQKSVQEYGCDPE